MTCSRCNRPIPNHLLGCEVCLKSPPEFPVKGPLITISLWPPWSSLVVLGAKKFETRGWNISHRGWIAIHATKQFAKEWKETANQTPFWNALREGGYKDAKEIPRGAIIGAAVLQQVYTTDQIRESVSPDEWKFGNFDDGRYAWALSNPVQIDPIPCKGRQRLWHAPNDAVKALAEAVSHVGREEER